MEMRKCVNGHYYDASVHQDCPYCTNQANSSATLPLDMGNSDGSPTMPLQPDSSGAQTLPLQQDTSEERTMPLNQAINNSDPDEGRTVALIKEDKGIDPVVGWLICIEGKEKGRDYRIHADNNFIGRSDRMDICVRGDETISRDNHAIISYDVQDNSYYFSPGDGRAIVRLNDKALFQTSKIEPYDKITIGKTSFLFLPFCNEKFMW